MLRRVALLLLVMGLAGCSRVGPQPGPSVPAPVQERPAQVRPAEPGAEVRRVGAEAGPSRRFAEVRGLWVVRTTLTSAEGIRTMVADADAAGFNTLLVQVRGRGDAYYASRWEPRAQGLQADGFDPLALVIEEAHSRGMAVHAWVNTHLVWSGPELPGSPDHMVNQHPDWLAVPRALAYRLRHIDPFSLEYVSALRRYAVERAETVEGVYSSPSHPRVQERVYDVWMDLAERYEVDGIHFDYVRFPSADFDYSPGALERFRTWVAPRLPPQRFRSLDEAFATDALAFTNALPGPWDEFRRAQITELVARIYHGVKTRRPDILVSAAVFSNVDDAYRFRFQDWRGWLDQGIVDVVVPMAYTPRDELFESQIREAAVSAGRQDRIWAGIGAYLNGIDGTLAKIDIARRQRVGGLILFSYDWAASEGSPRGAVPFIQQIGLARFDRR